MPPPASPAPSTQRAAPVPAQPLAPHPPVCGVDCPGYYQPMELTHVAVCTWPLSLGVFPGLTRAVAGADTAEPCSKHSPAESQRAPRLTPSGVGSHWAIARRPHQAPQPHPTAQQHGLPGNAQGFLLQTRSQALLPPSHLQEGLG